MTFEVWDLRSANRLVAFETSSDLAAWLVALVTSQGPEALEDLEVGWPGTAPSMAARDWLVSDLVRERHAPRPVTQAAATVTKTRERRVPGAARELGPTVTVGSAAAVRTSPEVALSPAAG